jgi:integrase
MSAAAASALFPALPARGRQPKDFVPVSTSRPFTVGLAIRLRSGECSALGWSDVNLDEATIEARRTLQRRNGAGLVLMPPKSEKSRRGIELPTICIKGL